MIIRLVQLAVVLVVLGLSLVWAAPAVQTDPAPSSAAPSSSAPATTTVSLPLFTGTLKVKFEAAPIGPGTWHARLSWQSGDGARSPTGIVLDLTIDSRAVVHTRLVIASMAFA